MEARSLATIAVRVVAVYVIAEGVMYLPSIHMLARDALSHEMGGLAIGTFAFAIVSPLLIGAILWAVAPGLSGWIVGRDHPVTSPDQEPATLFRLQAVAISTAGLIILALSLPGLFAFLIQLFGGARDISGEWIFNTSTIAHLTAVGLKVLLGIALILGAPFWARLLHRFRELGLASKPPE